MNSMSSFSWTSRSREGSFKEAVRSEDEWRFKYPCMADNFRFNYARLLEESYEAGVPLGKQKNPSQAKLVAVLGAGAAGTLATREMARAGYKVDLIEASGRIGGRLHSTRVPDGKGGAQLVCYEQGAMRVPFFPTTAPVVPGDGPYVGGPYHEEPTTAGLNSVAHFWVNKYLISTASFPNPGRAPGLCSDGSTRSFHGVSTTIYVNDGRGVDLVSIYPAPNTTQAFGILSGSSPGFGSTYRRSIDASQDKKASTDNLITAHRSRYPMPTKTFTYYWPANSPSVDFPTSDAAPFVRYYHHGGLIEEVEAPIITLAHAIPDDDENIPSTFLKSSPSYKADVKGWRAGIQALRTVAYKWTAFASSFLCAVTGMAWEVSGKPVVKRGNGWQSCMYDSPTWNYFWVNKVMPRYQNLNFYEVAMTGPVLPDPSTGEAPTDWQEGNFGGLGMNAAEAQLFYTVGCGDGSWGAFFPNSALWALRALLFGFAHEHQLLLGCLNAAQDGIDATLDPPADATPQGQARPTLPDSRGDPMWWPQYAGVASLAECHLFKPFDLKTEKKRKSSDGKEDGTDEKKDTPAAEKKPTSFWSLVQDKSSGCNIYASGTVTKIKRVAEEQIEITVKFPVSCSTNEQEEKSKKEVSQLEKKKGLPSKAGKTSILGSKEMFVYETFTYNYVLCTIPIWKLGKDIHLEGFPLPSLPIAVKWAMNSSHWIRSCKVFVALKAPYWQQPEGDKRDSKTLLPQVIVTNTELQDMYGLVPPTPADPYPTTGGVALLSYTWEDDAQKFSAYEERELVAMLVESLERHLERMGLPSFRPFMQDETLETPGSWTVWRWELEKEYLGAAKAYQKGIEQLNYSLLTYNTELSKGSNLYFAGDAYSLESGWMEPAMRMGLDATLNLLQNDANATVSELKGFAPEVHYRASRSLTNRQAGRFDYVGPAPGNVLGFGDESEEVSADYSGQASPLIEGGLSPMPALLSHHDSTRSPPKPHQLPDPGPSLRDEPQRTSIHKLPQMPSMISGKKNYDATTPVSPPGS